MRKVEDECVVSCIGNCMGNSCPYKNVVRYYCDKCGEEATLYHYDNEELCEYCLLNEFDVVEGSGY